MKRTPAITAATLACLAGHAVAQPVLDGIRDDAFYGTTPLWVQNQPTNFGDNSGASCDNTVVGNPGAVQTGVEIAIPLSALGNPAASNLKICLFINGQFHDFVSNQVLPGLPPGTPTQGTANLGNPRLIDFSTIAGGLGGNQFFSGVVNGSFAPTMDGKLTNTGFPNDAIAYGALKATQTCRTGFGDATTGLPGLCNGSELDGVYAVVNGGFLYMLIPGNLESNANKLEIFIDTGAAGGQNQLTATNPSRILAMCDNGSEPGLKFDAGFNANYWVGVGGYEDAGNYVGFVDFGQIGTTTEFYCGAFSAQTGGTLTGGDVGAPAILCTIDNSNTAGVLGFCPPPSGNPNTANGSEINSVYGRIFNNKLYLLVTGNCNSAFTKLNLFFDAFPGGQNRLENNHAPIDFNGFANMCDDGSGNGLTFDDGFFADYWLAYSNGNIGAGSPPSVQQYVNALVLRTNGIRRQQGTDLPLDYGAYDGGDKAQYQPVPFAGPLLNAQAGVQELYTNYAPRHAGAAVQLNPATPIAPPAGLLRVAYDNSNTAGVTATTITGAALVTTGLELEIDLAELACVENSPASCSPNPSTITSVKVAGFLSADSANGSNGGYGQMSNQVIGGMPSPDSPGATRNVNFAQFAGNQYIVVTNAAPSTCYANCDGSTGSPRLTANDFQCFLNKYASGDTYANCDGSTGSPLLTANDFQCFLNKFASGCT
ncbi:MAG: hypothetical protein KF678_00125 [Phycisphaeraceae bacterium]|nr:hypothetical protein [Phycisphaeraceae bacterium]